MRKYLLIYIVTITFYFNNSLYGQNLIGNPSLEDIESNKIDYWSVVSGTPDIASVNNQIIFPRTSGTFNPYITQIKSRKLDSIRFGQICLCQGFNSEWSEVTQVELIEPLKKNKQYKVSLYVIKVDQRQESIIDISVALTKKSLPKTDLPFKYTLNHLSLREKDKSPLKSKGIWKKVSGTYKANGREKYLSIGNFSGVNQSAINKIKGPGNSLYYCFDNIELIPHLKEEPVQTKVTPTPEPIPLEFEVLDEEDIQSNLESESIIIENSYFAFDSFRLSEGADYLFNQFVEDFWSSQIESITVIGYTDSIGNSDYNQKLSMMRALSVKNKLTELGLSAEIITILGIGVEKPIADNSTPEGRSKNRRVEINVVRNASNK